MIPSEYLNSLIERAFAEDLGDGDHSTLSCIDKQARGRAVLIAKQEGILAGIEIAEAICKFVSPDLHLEIFKHDGSKLQYGDKIFEITGYQHDILSAERTILNFLQRMSGIATTTAEYVNLLSGLKTQVLDTRKTTPGLRLIEKEAVRIGGGTNHRIGLYDMIMLKDNHIDFAGGITNAVRLAREYLAAKGKSLKIEVETRNLDDVAEVLSIEGVDRIMLDNFDIETTRKAVALIAGRIETESSGGITKENLRNYAECGVDFISVGALTHQIHSLDLSLKVVKD